MTSWAFTVLLAGLIAALCAGYPHLTYVPIGWIKVTSKKQIKSFLVGLPGTNKRYIVLKSAHNKYLSAKGNTIVNDKTHISQKEKFEIIFTNDGFVGLKTWKGKYLSAQTDGRLVADHLRQWEKFLMYVYDDRIVALKSSHGKWLSAQPNGRMKVNINALGPWEMFYGFPKAPNGWKKVTSKEQIRRFLVGLPGKNQRYIVLKSAHGKYLSAKGNTIVDDKTHISQKEKFEIIFTNDGFVGLKTWKGKYLSAQPDGRLLATADYLRQWEKFLMYVHGDRVALKSSHGKWLSAQSSGMKVNSNYLSIREMFWGFPKATK